MQGWGRKGAGQPVHVLRCLKPLNLHCRLASCTVLCGTGLPPPGPQPAANPSTARRSGTQSLGPRTVLHVPTP